MASLRAAAKLFSRNTAAAAQTMFAPPAALHMPVPGQKFTFASFARAVMMATPGKSTGVSKWFSVSKGYGFIVPDDGGPDLFVHQSNILAEGFRSLADGEPVEFVVDNSDVGRTKAVEVTGPDGSYVQGQPKQPFGGGRGHDDGGYGGGGYNQY